MTDLSQTVEDINGYRFLGDWSTLRRKNILSTILSLTSIRYRISMPTTVISDIFFDAYINACSDTNDLKFRAKKYGEVKKFLKVSDYAAFRKVQQTHMCKSLSQEEKKMKNELWYAAVSTKTKIPKFPWGFPADRLSDCKEHLGVEPAKSVRYILPGFNPTVQPNAGFSFERIGKRGKGRQELFRPSGIAVYNVNDMYANLHNVPPGYICKLAISDSGNNRVQLWDVQCVPYFPQTLEEKGGFQEKIIFDKLVGTTRPKVPEEVCAIRNYRISESKLSVETRLNAPDKLIKAVRDEKHYHIMKAWDKRVSELEDTKGYHLGQFTTPQNVEFDRFGTLYVTDNNNSRLGSPRLQAFAYSERFREPSEYIDNNTNVRGIAEGQVSMFADDENMPLRNPTGSSLLFSDSDGNTNPKVPMEDFFSMTAMMQDGHLEKGIAWSFPRFSRPLKLETSLTTNLKYYAHKGVETDFSRFNNESETYFLNLESKVMTLSHYFSRDMLLSFWRTPSSFSLVKREHMCIRKDQGDMGHRGFEAIYVAKDVPPALCWAVLGEIANGPAAETTNKTDDEVVVTPPSTQDQTEISLQLPGQAMDVLVDCYTEMIHGTKYAVFKCSWDTAGGSVEKFEVEEALSKRLRSTKVFQKNEEDRLNKLWQEWNSFQPPTLVVRNAKTKEEIRFATFEEYADFRDQIERKEEKRIAKLAATSLAAGVDENGIKKLVEKERRKGDFDANYKASVLAEAKIKHSLASHRKRVEDELSRIATRVKAEVEKVNKVVIMGMERGATWVKNELRSFRKIEDLQVCLRVLNILQSEQGKFKAHLNEKCYTHVHIDAMEDIVGKVEALKSSDLQNSSDEALNGLVDYYLDSENFQNFVDLAGVKFLLYLGNRFKDSQYCPQSVNASNPKESLQFFFLPHAARTVPGARPSLVPLESLIGREMFGKVKLVRGDATWTKGTVLCIDREVGMYVFVFQTSDGEQHSRMLPRSKLKDVSPSYHPLFKEPWGIATFQDDTTDVLVVGDARQDCLHFFNNHVDLKSDQLHESHYGSYLYTVGSSGVEAGKYRGPKGMVFDSFGRLLVADSKNNRVQGLVFLPLPKDDAFVRENNSRQTLDMLGQGDWVVDIVYPPHESHEKGMSLLNPSDVSVDAYDHYVVADTGHSCIKIFSRVVDNGPYPLKDARNVPAWERWKYVKQRDGKLRQRIPTYHLECLCVWGTRGHGICCMLEPVAIACMTTPMDTKTKKSNGSHEGSDASTVVFDEERFFVVDRALHCVHIIKWSPGIPQSKQGAVVAATAPASKKAWALSRIARS